MKTYLIPALLALLLCNCVNKGDPALYESAIAEKQAYKTALENLIAQVPRNREEIAGLSKEHRDLLAAQGKKMSEVDHEKMVQGQSAKLAQPAVPQPPAEVDLARLDDEQRLSLEKLTIECAQIATQIPLLTEIQKEREWLKADIARLKQAKPGK